MGDTITLRVGCEFRYEADAPVPSVVQVEPRRDGEPVLREARWRLAPEVARTEYLDGFGNPCTRLTIPAGEFSFAYQALVDVPDRADDADPDAPEVPVEDLPPELLVYTMPSRYCVSDVLSDQAWEMFGDMRPGWRRVQAVTEAVHDHLKFGYGSSTSTTTAADAFAAAQGVCRDFAHVAISFCRALNIPARYTFGYLPDIGVVPPEEPMDFCAWYEVWLGERWWTFDARNNQRRVGRVVIGRGRDAVDVAMVTSYGGPRLASMTVTAEPT
jgi:transglutaminase-like putative cysteine protease